MRRYIFYEDLCSRFVMLPDGAAAQTGSSDRKNGALKAWLPLTQSAKVTEALSVEHLHHCCPATLANAVVRIARHPQGRKSRSPAVRIRDGAPAGSSRGGSAPSGERHRRAASVSRRVRSSRPFLDNTSQLPMRRSASATARRRSARARPDRRSPGEAAGSPLSTMGISKILGPRGARLADNVWAISFPSWWRKRDTALPPHSPVESAWTRRARSFRLLFLWLLTTIVRASVPRQVRRSRTPRQELLNG